MVSSSGSTGLQDMAGVHGSGLMGNSNLLISETDLNDDKQATDFINVTIADQRRRRLGLERSWYQSIEFFQGNHWVRWDATEQRWSVEYRLPHRVRYIGNLISTYVATRTSKVLKNRPFLHTNPATTEPEDVETSVLATRVLRAEWENCKVNSRALPRWLNDVVLMGTGFLKVYFDPTKGAPIEFTDEDAELVGEEEGWSQRIGEARIEAVSPYWMYPDPAAESFEECRFIIDVRRKTLDDIRNRFGEETANNVSEADTFRPQDFYRARIRGYSGGTANQGYDQRTIPASLVKELWVRPCERYPKGYHVITAGDKVMHREEGLPEWCNGDLPYVALLDKEVPYRLWGASVMEDIRDIVKVRNRIMSQIIDNANLIGNPPIAIPSGSKLGAEDITGRPGAKWFYMPTQQGHKPEFINVPSLPDYVKSLPDRLEQDVMMITGFNEPTMQGSAPSNVRTASGLAALMKQDDSRQAVFVERMNGALSKAGELLLRCVASEYHEDRIAKIVGEKDRLTVASFKGEDLVGERVGMPGVNYFDVEIRVDSGHRSKEAQQQYLISLAQAQLVDIQNPDERRWLLRQLDVGAPDDELFGNITSIESQAHLENTWMSQVEDDQYMMPVIRKTIGPHDWDDHQVHLRIHHEHMRRSDFLKLDPKRWARFLEHVSEHEAKLQEEMAQEAAQQQMMAPPQGEGGPPQGGGGPPPAAMPGVGSRPGVGEDPTGEIPDVDLEQTAFAGVA